MSKFNRREFLKLSAIWGTVPLLPKWLSFREGVPEEEEPEEDMSSPWENGSDSPYVLDGGSSVNWRTYSSVDPYASPVMVWYDAYADPVVFRYDDREEPVK